MGPGPRGVISSTDDDLRIEWNEYQNTVEIRHKGELMHMDMQVAGKLLFFLAVIKGDK